MKIRPLGAELFHANGPTDMTILIVFFRNFAKRLIKTLKGISNSRSNSRSCASIALREWGKLNACLVREPLDEK